ncbi:MAG: hypothetical protein QM737_01345 [Ferruginibacter sp.]
MNNEIIRFEQMKFGMLRKLSGYLRISFAEIVAISPVIVPLPTAENIIKGYIVSFDPDAPAEIFEKIKKLSPGYSVFIGYYLLNELLPDPEVNN